jgi:hypothetical protein
MEGKCIIHKETREKKTHRVRRLVAVFTSGHDLALQGAPSKCSQMIDSYKRFGEIVCYIFREENRHDRPLQTFWRNSPLPSSRKKTDISLLCLLIFSVFCPL